VMVCTTQTWLLNGINKLALCFCSMFAWLELVGILSLNQVLAALSIVTASV
jgi:hypothetical protein